MLTSQGEEGGVAGGMARRDSGVGGDQVALDQAPQGVMTVGHGGTRGWGQQMNGAFASGDQGRSRVNLADEVITNR
jgi:hypothetical protein